MSGASLTQTQGGFLNPGGSWSVPLSIELSPPTSTQRGMHLTLTESSRDSCSYLMDLPGVHSQLVRDRLVKTLMWWSGKSFDKLCLCKNWREGKERVMWVPGDSILAVQRPCGRHVEGVEVCPAV